MFMLAFVTFGLGTAQANEVKVGMIMSYTGPLESLVPPMEDGAELAFNEVNASGELLEGSTIKLVKGDATCIDSAAAVTAAEVAIAEGVVAIFGADCSGVTKAITQNVGMPNGIPNISPAATSPALTTLSCHIGIIFQLLLNIFLYIVPKSYLIYLSNITSQALIYFLYVT